VVAAANGVGLVVGIDGGSGGGACGGDGGRGLAWWVADGSPEWPTGAAGPAGAALGPAIEPRRRDPPLGVTTWAPHTPQNERPSATTWPAGHCCIRLPSAEKQWPNASRCCRIGFVEPVATRSCGRCYARRSRSTPPASVP
jgi:hypothetical protein